MVGCKDKTILCLNFSPLHPWWVSFGMDDLDCIYSMLMATSVFQVPEIFSIMCRDMSPNNCLVVTRVQGLLLMYQIMC
ncbi:hypothetical protein CB1_000346009 [Camelus ferus]|nr:hypothetical protein CB1_000346009 [Camelus ferus]